MPTNLISRVLLIRAGISVDPPYTERESRAINDHWQYALNGGIQRAIDRGKRGGLPLFLARAWRWILKTVISDAA